MDDNGATLCNIYSSRKETRTIYGREGDSFVKCIISSVVILDGCQFIEIKINVEHYVLGVRG